MKTRFLEVVKFGFTSLAGVILDLVVFFLLIELQVSIVATGTISGTAAILTSSFLSMRFAFSLKYSTAKHFLLAAYYFLSIIVFASLIAWFSQWSELQPIEIKVISLPISFTVNYLGSKKILRR
jgi:putative flippase GtrA